MSQKLQMFWSQIHFWTSAFECHKMENTNLGFESFLPPFSVPSMWQSEVDILWGISWSDSCSGIHKLHTHRQPKCSWPMLQTLLHGRMNAALPGSMTLLSTNHSWPWWWETATSILVHDFHLTTFTLVVWTSHLHHTSWTICLWLVMGCVFCAYRNQITVCTSSLVHFLSTVAMWHCAISTFPAPVEIPATVGAACTNVWQNSSLQSFVLQEYNWRNLHSGLPPPPPPYTTI